MTEKEGPLDHPSMQTDAERVVYLEQVQAAIQSGTISTWIQLQRALTQLGPYVGAFGGVSAEIDAAIESVKAAAVEKGLTSKPLTEEEKNAEANARMRDLMNAVRSGEITTLEEVKKRFFKE